MSIRYQPLKQNPFRLLLIQISSSFKRFYKPTTMTPLCFFRRLNCPTNYQTSSSHYSDQSSIANSHADLLPLPLNKWFYAAYLQPQTQQIIFRILNDISLSFQYKRCRHYCQTPIVIFRAPKFIDPVKIFVRCFSTVHNTYNTD